MTETVSTRKGVFLMLFSVVLFAINCLLIRGLGLFAEVDGWMASFTRGLAGTFFVVAVYSRGRGLELTHLRKPLLIMRGVIGVITITILYFTIIHLGAARALVLNLTYPLFGTFIAAAVLREKVKPAIVVLLLLAFVGLGLFFSDSLAHATFSHYDLLALFGALLAGVVVVFIRKLSRTESAATIYSSQCVATLLLTTPMAFSSFGHTSPLAWLLLMVAGVVVAYGQILITRGFYHLNVAQGSALQMLIPILTGVGAFFIFGEYFTPLELTGAVITLFATWRISIAR